MSALVFNEERHEYTIAGRRIPSVTQILAPLVDYSMVPREMLERAQALGTAVHRMTELYDNDDLDEESLSNELRPYLGAWIKFRTECQFEPVTIEHRMSHPVLRYAGTSDRTGAIKGRLAVLDIKKMLVLGPHIGPQLAAYEKLHQTEGLQVLDRFALGLRPDGTYRLKSYTDSLDWQCFLSLLTIQNWKAKHEHR